MNGDTASFTRANQIRRQLRLPIRICEFLDYEETTIKQAITPKKRTLASLCRSRKKKKRYFIDDQFITVFQRMTLEEKIKLYAKSVEYLKLILGGAVEPVIMIQTTSFEKVLVQGGTFGMSWIENRVRLNYQLGTLEMSGSKDAIIDLDEYLIRSSTDWRKYVFVIQAIKPGFTEAFRFGFDNKSDCEKCFQSISLLVDKCLFECFKKQVKGLKDFKLPFEQEQFNLKVLASRVRSPGGEDMENLLTSYIQQEMKQFCLQCGELSLNQFNQRFQLYNPQSHNQNSLFPTEYNEEMLYEQSNFSPTSQHPDSMQQLKTDPTIFRLNKLYQFPIQEMINCLSDVEYFEKWNSQIKASNMLAFVKEANSIIVSQIHKPIVKYYQARIFTYLRTMFRKGDVVYIVDRNVSCEKGNQFEHFVKGVVVFQVWKLIPKSNTTLVDVVVKLDHKMIKNPNIEIRLTGLYLEGLYRLDEYLKYNPQRAVQLFDTKFSEADYKQTNQSIYSKYQQKEGEDNTKTLFPLPLFTNKEGKPNIAVKYQGDSFFSAAGGSDWNSKMGSMSSRKSSFKDSKKDVLPKIMKSVRLLQHISPIIEQPSANVSSESRETQTIPMLLNMKQSQQTSKSIKYLKQTTPLVVSKVIPIQPQRVGAQWPQPVFTPPVQISPINSIQNKPQEDPYTLHISPKKAVQLNQRGYAITPKAYLNPPAHYPMQPKKEYPYIKMTGNGWSHYLLKNIWTILPNGQFKCINQQMLKGQTGVFSSIMKRAATNLLSGKGLNISLPVEVFSQLSILQLIARGICFAPRFIQVAATSPDPLQRLKLAICFSIGFSLAYLEMAKPFNPIIGETYQCWINGCPYYAQQISHHPAISSYLFIGRGYKISGTITPQIQLSMNSGIGYNTGECVIQFSNYPNHKIYLRSPGGEVEGLAYGERKFSFTNKGIYCDSLGSYSELTFNPHKKSMFSFGKQTKQVDIVQGNIYSINKSDIQQFRKKNSKTGVNKKLLKTPICSITGRYSQEIRFDNVTYFNTQSDQPCSYDQQQFPLASNSNFRQDIIYRAKGQLPAAQQNKQRLEQLQRRDAKLRKKQK